MIAVLEHAIGAGGGEALNHQHRLVMGDAVVALVELRHHDDGELEIAAFHLSGGAQLEQQPHEMGHRRRAMGENRHLVAERAIAGDEALIDLARLLRQLGGTDIAYPRHFSSFTAGKVVAIFTVYYAQGRLAPAS
jgi:hypothetical protein